MQRFQLKTLAAEAAVGRLNIAPMKSEMNIFIAFHPNPLLGSFHFKSFPSFMKACLLGRERLECPLQVTLSNHCS